MTHVTQFGLASGSFAVQSRIGVGRRGVGIVLAPLAVKVRSVALIRTILRLETLLRCPCLDEGSVDRKVLVRQQRLDLRMRQKRAHEALKHITLLKALAVRGERGRGPDRIIRRKSDEPAEQ